jgi:translation initiation factor IF-1
VKNAHPPAAVGAVITAVAVAVAVAIKRIGISSRGSVGTGLRLFIFRFVPVADPPAMSEQHIEVEGRVTVVLPGTMFRVELDNKHVVLATICGKMRKRWVRLTVGDRVKMEISPYDLDKARIIWRLK